VLVLRLPGWGMLCSEDVDVSLPEATTKNAWVAAVVDLVDDLDRCRRDGASLAHRIAKSHGHQPWLGHIEQLYNAVRPRNGDIPSVTEGRPSDYDVTLVGFQEAAEPRRDLISLLSAAGLMPSELS